MPNSDSIEAAFQGQLGAFRLDVEFKAPLRGITALFGPSGCGKDDGSTLLGWSAENARAA